VSVNNGHDWLMGLHAGYAVTEEWLQEHYIPTVKALMDERDKLIAVFDIAKLMLGASTPEAYQRYGERLYKAVKAIEGPE